jgi:alkylation response protein AidB-like acyl-CoA dehydrogenase
VDFNDLPEDAAFRAEWRAWLAANATPVGPDAHGFGAFVLRGASDDDLISRARDWQARLARDGWGAISWPVEHGGRAATATQAWIYGQELAAYDVPPDAYQIGLGMIGPTIIACGTPEQQARYLPAMLDGSEIWCQLWSEPEAGSDVASLRTRAEWDASRDAWIVNGQKVWTSGAQWSSYGLALVRTNQDAPKHRGISALIIDMTAPGVEIRPLREMSGGTTFNEVFFTDVEVPASNVVGAVDQGWTVALTTMAHERLAAGLMGLQSVRVQPLIDLASRLVDPQTAPSEAASVRHRLVDLACRQRMLELTVFRTLTTAARTGAPGPESSTLKLTWSMIGSDQAELALDLLGTSGMLAGDGAPLGGEVVEAWSFAPSFHIGGGTDEVQRTVIAEHVLGLPREPKVPA